MAQLSCPHCGSPVNVGAQHAGRAVRCPSCQGQMMIPAGGGGGSGRSGGGKSKKKSKKGSESNTGLIIGLSAGIGGVAILAAIIVIFVMNRDDGGSSVASNTNTSSPSTTTTTNNSSTAPSSPMGAHGSAPSGAHTTPMSTSPMGGTSSVATTPMGTNPVTSPNPPGGTQIASATPVGPEAVPAADTSTSPPMKPSDTPAVVSGDGLPAIPNADLTLPDLIRFVQPGVVRLEVESEVGSSLGSGFVINKSGMIATNYHVIAGAVSAMAFFETGESFAVTGAWHLDQARDIAILQIDCPPDKLFPVNIANDVPAQGIDVAAFGAPHGLSFTVTKGIVSAIRSGAELESDHAGTLVQHDVSINPGNSGGPLCTFRGEVVAINTFLLRNSQNLNFAISCLDIRDCISKAYSETLAINPQNIPSKQGEIPGAIDYTDTEKGDTLLARIRHLDLFTLNLARDPSGVIERYLDETAESQIERAGIEINNLNVRELSQLDFRNPVMIIIYHFALPEDEDEDEATARVEVMVHMQVVMVDVNAEGKEELCIIWNREEERIGSVALLALARGQLPNSVEDGIRGFIGEFVGRWRRARNG